MSGCVNWMYVLCAVPGYTIGNYVGASMAISKGAKFVHPMYYGIIALLFICAEGTSQAETLAFQFDAAREPEQSRKA